MLTTLGTFLPNHLTQPGWLESTASQGRDVLLVDVGATIRVIRPARAALLTIRVPDIASPKSTGQGWVGGWVGGGSGGVFGVTPTHGLTGVWNASRLVTLRLRASLDAR